jgi:hypothetical protein
MAIHFSLEEIRWLAIVLLPLSRAPNRKMNEADLIALVERSNWVTRAERSSVPSRNDTRIANRIHNWVSHRDSAKNPIRLRLIEWDRYSSHFALTERGADFLGKLVQKLGGCEETDFGSVDNWLTRSSVT